MRIGETLRVASLDVDPWSSLIKALQQALGNPVTPSRIVLIQHHRLLRRAAALQSPIQFA